jgi:hypothetical protein
MSKYFALIPVVAIVLIVLIVLFFKYAGKINKAASLKVGKKSFKEEVLYAFHLMFHPFDGFWDLKHEQRGSVRGAMFWIIVAIITFFYQSIGTGYIFNPRGEVSTIFIQIIAVFVPLILWVTSNWCLTTLFEGEGSFKDVYIATCYSLVPLPLLIIPSVMISNVLTITELEMVTMIQAFAFIWLGMLVFFGMMVTHDYTVGKNILTCVATIVGMAFIMFLGVLFSSLMAKIVSFVTNIIEEINYRL